jgi:hypothetical protein
MIIRVSDYPSEGNLPGHRDPQTSDGEPYGKAGLLPARSAAILGASLLIAVIAGMLADIALGKSAASVPGSILAAGTTFAGAIRLLNSIIA